MALMGDEDQLGSLHRVHADSLTSLPPAVAPARDMAKGRCPSAPALLTTSRPSAADGGYARRAAYQADGCNSGYSWPR